MYRAELNVSAESVTKT